MPPPQAPPPRMPADPAADGATPGSRALADSNADAQRRLSSEPSSEGLPAGLSSARHSVGRPSGRSPVGIFDSGLGGLSVLRAVRAQLPDESLIYAADSRYAPYGERDEDFIADRTLAIGEWLVTQGLKVLVWAAIRRTSNR